ncbi:MAG: hypothetical protein QOD67_2464, partial [Caballeronia sp.]|nr:hypothetical protein [Caballeronia sp.]
CGDRTDHRVDERAHRRPDRCAQARCKRVVIEGAWRRLARAYARANVMMNRVRPASFCAWAVPGIVNLLMSGRMKRWAANELIVVHCDPCLPPRNSGVRHGASAFTGQRVSDVSPEDVGSSLSYAGSDRALAEDNKLVIVMSAFSHRRKRKMSSSHPSIKRGFLSTRNLLRTSRRPAHLLTKSLGRVRH